MEKPEPGTPPAQARGLSAGGEDRNEAVSRREFSFRYGDRAFEAWIHDDGNGPSVYVTTAIGVLPYSAENRAARRSALSLLGSAETVPGTHLVLTDLHRLSVIARSRIGDPGDTVELLSGAAAAVFNSQPLIELLEDCLELAPADQFTFGRTNTCPG